MGFFPQRLVYSRHFFYGSVFFDYFMSSCCHKATQNVLFLFIRKNIFTRIIIKSCVRHRKKNPSRSGNNLSKYTLLILDSVCAIKITLTKKKIISIFIHIYQSCRQLTFLNEYYILLWLYLAYSKWTFFFLAFHKHEIICQISHRVYVQKNNNNDCFNSPGFYVFLISASTYK